MGFSLTLPMTDDLWLAVGGLRDEDIPHRWVLGSRGGTHCPDCLELAGEVRTLGEWMNTIMPGSGSLHCGSGCRCRLEPTVSRPTEYTILLPYQPGDWIERLRLIHDPSRSWRFNFNSLRQITLPAAIHPVRSPSASLPRGVAADRVPWWDSPLPARPYKPVHGVD